MRIQPPAAYLVATRMWHEGLPEASQQWPDDHDGSTQAGTFILEFRSFEVLQVYIVSLESI